jgi:hypothetical protein
MVDQPTGRQLKDLVGQDVKFSLVVGSHHDQRTPVAAVQENPTQ